MSIQTYQQALRAARAPVVGLFRALVSFLNAPPTQRQIAYMTQQMIPKIVDARRMTAAATLQYHRERSPAGTAPFVPIPLYDAKAFVVAMQESLVVPWASALERQVPFDKETAVDRAEAWLVAQVQRVDRYIAKEAAWRGDATAYVRILQGETNCAFCVMLASRGPVYATVETAQAAGPGMAVDAKPNMGAYGRPEYQAATHPNCDCLVIPVFGSQDRFPGYESYLAAEDTWIKATKGKKYTEALNALRQYLAANPASIPLAA